MPISGLEDLLPPTASSGRGGAKAAGGWEPRLASLPHPAPSLQLRFSPWCTQPRCRKEPHEGRPGGGLMAPTADLPLAPPWRGCGRNMSPSPADGEARLDPRPGVVLATRRGGRHRAGPFSRKPLVGSLGVGQSVTCGLSVDMLWDLAVLRILCLEIA